MRINIYCLLLSVSLISSCKKGAINIDIDDVQKHRAYQDSAVGKGKTDTEKLGIIKNLVDEYRSLNNDENKKNTHYNYYLGRLYSNIIDLSFYNFIYDTINKKLYNQALYIDYIDSSIYFNQTALELDSNNLYAFYGIVRVLTKQEAYWQYTKKEFKEIPEFSKRNIEPYNKLIKHTLDNSIRIIDLDTTTDKSLSRYINEVALLKLLDNLYGRNLEMSDSSTRNQLLKIDKIFNFLNKHDELYHIDKSYYSIITGEWKNVIQLAKDEEIRLIEYQNNLEKLKNTDLKHKYFFVDVTANISALIELSSWDVYSYVAGNLYGDIYFRGHGDWKRPFINQITTTNTSSGTIPTGEINVSLNKEGKILLTLPKTGAVYIQDDDGYYIKNHISTPKE